MELSFELPQFIGSLLDNTGLLLSVIIFGVPLVGVFAVWFAFQWINLLFKLFRLQKVSKAIEGILMGAILITWLITFPLSIIAIFSDLDRVYIPICWSAIFLVSIAFMSTNLKAMSGLTDEISTYKKTSK